MAKSVKALINPAMLTWAREQAGYSLADAAHKLGLDQARLQALEDDEETPTFAKLLDMADLYKRPVSLFYLKKPPEGLAADRGFPTPAWRRGRVSPQLLRYPPGAGTPRGRASRRDGAERAGARVHAARDAGYQCRDAGRRIREFLEVSEANQQRFAKKAFEGWRTGDRG